MIERFTLSIEEFAYGLAAHSIEEASENPYSVKRLYLRGTGWDRPETPVEKCAEVLKSTIRLRKFTAGWQSWTNLPAELSNLADLGSVTILNTPIRQFPEFLQACPRLEELCLRGTDISDIPKSIAQFRKLRTLDLTNSSIHEVPEELFSLPKLRRLIFDNVPIPIQTETRLRRWKQLNHLFLARNIFQGSPS